MTQRSLSLFSSGVQLRPYQQACLAAIEEFRAKGGKRALVGMATGLGKTIIFSQLPEMFPGKRALVLSHREELLDQSAGKIMEANSHLSVAIEQADRHAPPGTQVVVASVQTLALNRKRLEALDPAEFGLVIHDESHHAVARTHIAVLAHFGLAPEVPADLSRKKVRALFRDFKPRASAPFLCGWTATTNRTDGQGLEYLFDQEVYSMSIQQGIGEGWLARIRGQRVYTETDITSISITRGDFAEGELASAINTPARNALVVKGYLDYATGRQGLVFAADVEHVYALRDAFTAAGVSAAAVIGATPSQDRHHAVEAYKRGDITLLVNHAVLTEGFDAPTTGVLVMARPTRSSLVYTQMLGRGTRVAPGKADLLVLDMVDVAKVGIADLTTMFGLPPKFKLSGEDVEELRAQVEEMEDQVPMKDLLLATSIAEIRTMAADFDPLRMAMPESWLMMALAWVKTSSGYALGLPSGDQIGIVTNLLGHGELRVRLKGEKAVQMGYYYALQDAVSAGERWVREQRPDAVGLLARNASWRSEKALPTSKQLWRARKEGIRLLDQEVDLYRALERGDQEAAQEIEDHYTGRTKGEMSLLITQVLAGREA